MTATYTWPVIAEDIQILRDLYRQKREESQKPKMAARKQLWSRHASLDSRRPMILAETSGVLDEMIPLTSLRCQADWARQMERGLREVLYRSLQVDDDYVIEGRIEYGWDITIGDFGVRPEIVRGENQGKLASYHWDPPIQDLDYDFDKLHFRSLSVNREKTQAWKEFLEQHFGDILPVELRGSYWWTSGLTWSAIDLIGLQPLMMILYDNPAGLHRLMAFLRDDFLHLLDWFESEKLLTLNNQNDYVGSGSIGYTTELPSQVKTAGQAVLARDLWGLSESQETVGVSPRMFEEFIFPYQLPVVERFGLSYYGCCEPVHTRFHVIKQFPNLRRVSVSPWCNQERITEMMDGKYIFCRKPNPTLISTEGFDEEAIRADVRATLNAAGSTPLELVMKDVHTLHDEPARLGRWVSLAREVCQEFGFPDETSTAG
jgi:hypothetical protein